MNRLMLCAGQARRDGWKTLDSLPRYEADFTATIPPLPLEVKAIAWHEIEWVHGITSFYPWEAMELLREIRSVLQPEGILALEQPDFREAIHKVEWLFGDPGFKNPLHMNRWAYSPETLSDLLRASGFSRIDTLPAKHHLPERDFRLEARP